MWLVQLTIIGQRQSEYFLIVLQMKSEANSCFGVIAQTGASQFCCKFIVLLAPFCFYGFAHFYRIEISSQSPLEFNRFI